MKQLWWLALFGLMFTACTPTTDTAVAPQPSPETAVLPTSTISPPVTTNASTPTTAATAVPDPTATIAVTAAPTSTAVLAETGVISGRTEEGAFFLGDPNAPITHIDYSDFL